MKFIELFGGIGGFSYGIRETNEEIRLQRDRRTQSQNRGSEKSVFQRRTESPTQKSRFECVGYYEIDKYAVQTYNKNFGTKHEPTDITKVRAEDIPDHDILCAGFPCQSFSIAGKRKGFEDTRGTMFFEIARIVKHKKPRYIWLENVKGLLNHDNGRTFGKILATLDELGYDAEWQVLNSKHFGVPQNRERVFIIGHLRETSPTKVFPIGESSEGVNERSIKTIVARTFTAGGHSGGHHSGMTLIGTWRTHKDGQGFRAMKENISPTLCARAREDGRGQPVITRELSRIRRLTPIECERLQGFPDNWTEGVSDTQRYKQLGNAVTTDVITEIAKKLIMTKIHI